MFLFFFFLFSFVVSYLIILYSVHHDKIHQHHHRQDEEGKSQDEPTLLARPLSDTIDENAQASENNPTHLSHSLHLQILPSDSTKWAGLVTDGNQPEGDNVQVVSVGEGERVESGGEEHTTTTKKKKKKRGKKKRLDSKREEETKEKEESCSGSPVKPQLTLPFTSMSSVMQRKIKQQYDEFIKCCEDKTLDAVTQMGEISKVMHAVRDDLEHRSEIFKRKYSIIKALLSKADRSSHDRLSQQMNQVRMEQKRLEDDGHVYNCMQEQLNRSPAYKKLIVLGGFFEIKALTEEQEEDKPVEDFDEGISFEELLAQEKKDSFWQKHGKPKLSSN